MFNAKALIGSHFAKSLPSQVWAGKASLASNNLEAWKRQVEQSNDTNKDPVDWFMWASEGAISGIEKGVF